MSLVEMEQSNAKLREEIAMLRLKAERAQLELERELALSDAKHRSSTDSGLVFSLSLIAGVFAALGASWLALLVS